MAAEKPRLCCHTIVEGFRSPEDQIQAQIMASLIKKRVVRVASQEGHRCTTLKKGENPPGSRAVWVKKIPHPL